MKFKIKCSVCGKRVIVNNGNATKCDDCKNSNQTRDLLSMILSEEAY